MENEEKDSGKEKSSSNKSTDKLLPSLGGFGNITATSSTFKDDVDDSKNFWKLGDKFQHWHKMNTEEMPFDKWSTTKKMILWIGKRNMLKHLQLRLLIQMKKLT